MFEYDCIIYKGIRSTVHMIFFVSKSLTVLGYLAASE